MDKREKDMVSKKYSRLSVEVANLALEVKDRMPVRARWTAEVALEFAKIADSIREIPGHDDRAN